MQKDSLMQSFLRILFFFFLVSELVFSFSKPLVWEYPAPKSFMHYNLQEEKISSLQNDFFKDFCYFEFVEKDEQNEENDNQSKNHTTGNKSDFSKTVVQVDRDFLTQQKSYLINFQLIQTVSLLVLFHSWKFHI